MFEYMTPTTFAHLSSKLMHDFPPRDYLVDWETRGLERVPSRVKALIHRIEVSPYGKFVAEINQVWERKQWRTQIEYLLLDKNQQLIFRDGNKWFDLAGESHPNAISVAETTIIWFKQPPQDMNHEEWYAEIRRRLARQMFEVGAFTVAGFADEIVEAYPTRDSLGLSGFLSEQYFFLTASRTEGYIVKQVGVKSFVIDREYVSNAQLLEDDMTCKTEEQANCLLKTVVEQHKIRTMRDGYTMLGAKFDEVEAYINTYEALAKSSVERDFEAISDWSKAPAAKQVIADFIKEEK